MLAIDMITTYSPRNSGSQATMNEQISAIVTVVASNAMTTLKSRGAVFEDEAATLKEITFVVTTAMSNLLVDIEHADQRTN